MADRASRQASLPLGWVSRDAWLIIGARGLRTFAQASVTILLALYLDLLGFTLAQIGAFISVGLAGSAFFAFIVVLVGDTWGRRRLLTGFTLFTTAVGLALAFTDQFLLLAVVAFIGSFNAAGGGPAGPVQPLEQAALPETAPSEKRTDLFAVYGVVTTGARAVGSLAAGLPAVFQATFHMDELSSYRMMFVGFTIVSALGSGLYALLSPAVEAPRSHRRWSNPLRMPSRRIIFNMAGVFAVDTFATRLVVHSLVALWFRTTFGIDVGSIAFIFFGATVMNAISMWIAAKLATRFGLLNTIVLTHVPAVLAVAAIPFMPTAGLAVAMWLTRAFFAQMDVPTRQSYTMAVVGADERVAMSGINNLAQSGLGTASPSVATALMGSLWAGAPFIASGALKAVYLLGFYLMFRHVRPPEEQHGAEASLEQRGAGA